MRSSDVEWRLDSGAVVGRQLHRILRERIIRNDLPPGRGLSEAEIAGHFAVSRQPVREAFIKLAEEGLVEIRPQRGTFVRKISVEAVMASRFMREAVEADIIRFLADAVDVDTVDDLRAQIDDQQRAEGDPERFMELDDAFHRSLAVASGRGSVWDLVVGLKAQMDRVRHLSLLRFPVPKLVAQHAAVVEAVANRDAAGAEAAMRGHLREILSDLPKIAADWPDYFEASSERQIEKTGRTQ